MSTHLHKFFIIPVVWSLVGCNFPGTQLALADFGDAPDPTFPSLLASDGARTLDPSQFWLGSLEAPGATLEQDAQIIDRDQDDGLIEVLVENKVNLVFQASKSPQAQAGVVYFNLLADENGDGQWQDFLLPSPGGSLPTSSPSVSSVDQMQPSARNFTEWVVVNQPVTLGPGETTTIKAEVLQAGGNLQVWLRAALTDSPINVSPRWDGTGQFQQGEIEDHLIGPEYACDVRCNPNPLIQDHGWWGVIFLVDTCGSTDMKVTNKVGEVGGPDPAAADLEVDPSPGDVNPVSGDTWLNFRNIWVRGTRRHAFTDGFGNNTISYQIDFMVKGPLGVKSGSCKVIIRHPAVAAPPPTTAPTTAPPLAPPTISPTPTPIPTLTPTITPTIRVDTEIITLSLSSTTIEQGKTLKINGKGFTPNGRVRKDILCERGLEFGFDTKADGNGKLIAALDMMGMLPGQCTVVVTDLTTGRQASAIFEIIKK